LQHAALQLHPIESTLLGYKDVYFERTGQVNNIEATALLNRAPPDVEVNIESVTQASGQWFNMLRAKFGYYICVNSGPHYTMYRTGQRSADEIRYTKGLKDIHHE